MKKIAIGMIVLFLIAFLWVLHAGAADIDVLIYCDDNYPPYSFEIENEAKGVYTDILRTAFSRMNGYKVQIKAVPWKRGLNYLKNGTGFALFPPYHRTKERPYIWPYSMPILDERVVVFCRYDIIEESARPMWPEDYYGLTIGNNAGFKLGGDKFYKALEEDKIKLDEAKGNKENILKLGHGRIDCYINDRLSILWELKELKKSGTYDEHKHKKIAEGPTISIEQGFLGFTAMDKGNFYFKEDFVKKLNVVLYNMRRTGELQTIVDRYIK